ncbi:hypothetical protein ABVK25_006109 [Lepraria finkii]|uniref:Uncharacterized protein n=1 Tax=Lepraria finkii TaxID=1340010 RepID=A0ABR4B6H0_9LECA
MQTTFNVPITPKGLVEVHFRERTALPSDNRYFPSHIRERGFIPLRGRLYLRGCAYISYSSLPICSQQRWSSSLHIRRFYKGIFLPRDRWADRYLKWGAPGTAIVWVLDPKTGLRAWHAVPDSDGTMRPIALPQSNLESKSSKWAGFQRPVFGNDVVFNFGNGGSKGFEAPGSTSKQPPSVEPPLPPPPLGLEPLFLPPLGLAPPEIAPPPPSPPPAGPGPPPPPPEQAPSGPAPLAQNPPPPGPNSLPAGPRPPPLCSSASRSKPAAARTSTSTSKPSIPGTSSSRSKSTTTWTSCPWIRFFDELCFRCYPCYTTAIASALVHNLCEPGDFKKTC